MTDAKQIHPPIPRQRRSVTSPLTRGGGDHGVVGSISVYLEDRLQGLGLGPFQASMPVTSLALSHLLPGCWSLSLHGKEGNRPLPLPDSSAAVAGTSFMEE